MTLIDLLFARGRRLGDKRKEEELVTLP